MKTYKNCLSLTLLIITFKDIRAKIYIHDCKQYFCQDRIILLKSSYVNIRCHHNLSGWSCKMVFLNFKLNFVLMININKKTGLFILILKTNKCPVLFLRNPYGKNNWRRHIPVYLHYKVTLIKNLIYTFGWCCVITHTHTHARARAGAHTHTQLKLVEFLIKILSLVLVVRFYLRGPWTFKSRT